MRMKLTGILSLFLLAILVLSAGCASAEKTITLTFTGDCTIGGKEEGRGIPSSFEGYVKKYGYDYFFANFRRSSILKAFSQTSRGTRRRRNMRSAEPGNWWLS